MKSEKPKKELLNINIESELKKQFDEVCSELGLTMTVAVTMLVKQMVRDRRLPFLPDAGNNDNNIIIEAQSKQNINANELLAYYMKMNELNNKEKDKLQE